MTTASPATAMLDAAQRAWLKQLAAALDIRLSDGPVAEAVDGTDVRKFASADRPKAPPPQPRNPPKTRRSKTVLTVSPSGQTKEGAKVKLSATVTTDDAKIKPLGTVQFEAVLIHGPIRKILAKVPLKDGNAVHTETKLPPGDHRLEAIYIPDTEGIDRSQSAPTSHNVLAVSKDEYERARKPALAKLADCLVSARAYDLFWDRVILTNLQKDMETAAKAAQYQKARDVANELAREAEEYLKKAAEKQNAYDKTTDEITKKLDAASPATRGDVAKDLANGLAGKTDELRYLRIDIRNRLLKEMQENGTFTDERKKACKVLLSQRYLDPEFEKKDKENRQKLIEKMKNDPDYKTARDNWTKLTLDQRVGILQKTIDYQAEVYGFAKTTIDTFSDEHGDMGTYRHSTGKVRLNTHDEVLKKHGFDEALDTIVHEMAHRQQALLADDLKPNPPKPAKIKKGDPFYNQAMSFKLNDTPPDGFFVFPGDPPPVGNGKEYETQPSENHSRQNAEAIKNAKIGR